MSPPCLDFAGNWQPPPTPPHTPFVPGEIKISEELGKGVMPEGERWREGRPHPPRPGPADGTALREPGGKGPGPGPGRGCSRGGGPCRGGSGARPARRSGAGGGGPGQGKAGQSPAAQPGAGKGPRLQPGGSGGGRELRGGRGGPVRPRRLGHWGRSRGQGRGRRRSRGMGGAQRGLSAAQDRILRQKLSSAQTMERDVYCGREHN